MAVPAPRRSWLEEKSRNRTLEDKLKDRAVYEVEVKTGRMKVSGDCVPLWHAALGIISIVCHCHMVNL